jgi:hypothetical protein
MYCCKQRATEIFLSRNTRFLVLSSTRAQINTSTYHYHNVVALKDDRRSANAQNDHEKRWSDTKLLTRVPEFYGNPKIINCTVNECSVSQENVIV